MGRLVVLLGWFWGVAIGWAQVEIRAYSLLGREAITSPLPVRVEFQNRGATTEGVLEWQNGSGLRSRLPLQLPSGSRKALDLSLALGGWSSQGEHSVAIEAPSLWWREREREQRPVELEWGTGMALPVVIIGDLKGGFESWRYLPLSTLYTFGKQEVSSRSGWHWQAVYWSPEQMPTQWQMMLGLPVIVLVEGAERLREEQWHALMAWMLAGGHLLVSAGSIGRFPQKIPLDPLLPPLGTIQRVRLSQPLSSHEPLELPREPIALLRTPGWDEATAKWVSGEYLLACARRVGLGRLTLFLGDLTAPAWRSWKGYSVWVRQLIGEVEIPAMALRFEYPSFPLWKAPTRQQLGMLAAYFGLYWILIWKLWRWLGRHRRLIYAPLALLGLTFPLLLLLSSSLPTPFRKPQYRANRLLLADRLVPLALDVTIWHFGLPSGTYTLRWEQGSYLLTHRLRGVFLGATQTEVAKELQLKFQVISALEPVVRTVRLIDLPISVVKQGDKTLWVNPLPTVLKRVQMQRGQPWYGMDEGVRQVAPLADEVMPRAPISLRVQSGSPRTPPVFRGNEWLVAEVVALPSALATPIVGEGKSLLWVRIR